ncbi:unnamed protein product, partial [Meganyctiphanes norvegica]
MLTVMSCHVMVIRAYMCSYILQSCHGSSLCPHPAVPINTRVDVTERSPGSVATYTCDPGYTLFGDAEAVCGANGKWTGKLPLCASNVAWKKPVNQSSTARGGKGENANDGDRTTAHDGDRCTETQVESSPWWMVDLLQEYEVTTVRVTTRGCCGDHPLEGLEIRMGDSRKIQRNRLCAWYPGVIEAGTTKDLTCASPMKGRYVFIQMQGIKGSMSLCEVEVFSTQEFSKDRCSAKTELSQLGIFNKTCYEFQTKSGGTFANARKHCQSRGGDLVHGIGDGTHAFLASELTRFKKDMTTQLVWIGAEREPTFVSRTWHWVDATEVEETSWGPKQPNNYNGKQDCVVLDGGSSWLWNDVGCDLNYLHWVCQFKPTICGSPDRKENTTVSSKNFSRDSVISYECPEGHRVLGDTNRTCLNTGFWNGTAPTCKYVDCSAPPEVEHSTVVLVDGRTTHGAKAVYQCAENYTTLGEDTSVCGDEGNWSEPATCLYSWCSEIEAPNHGGIQMSGRRSGDTASFTCEAGYKLIGHKTISCALGGTWSGEAPQCRFIECGLPENLRDGQMILVNQTTYLNSIVKYECGEDFWIDGPEERICMEDGHWSSVSPICMKITCDSPELPEGGYVTGYNFDVHSEVQYHCSDGHYLEGDNIRVCTRDRVWTGDSPSCIFVDCDAVPSVPFGDVYYLNETTTLGSVIEITCNKNHRLVGDFHRVCLKTREWSGSQPECEEIRCGALEHPIGAKHSIAGNDGRISAALARRRGQPVPKYDPNTFKVGSVITYRCDRGHVVEGTAQRTCTPKGTWNNEAPSCKYVECPKPESIKDGIYRLLSNETQYGSQVAYECMQNWKLKGHIRRYCQANETWSGKTPVSIEVLCPDVSNSLTEALLVDLSDQRVGSFATYSCELGRKVVGEPSRECLVHGHWGGSEPRCEWVECPQPDEIENGRTLRLNSSLLYGSIVEYHCFPKYRLRGSFTRSCTADGTWSDKVPQCTLDDGDSGIFVDNTLDGTANAAKGVSPASQEEASNTGLIVGLIIGLIAVIVVAVALVFFRTKRQQKMIEDPRAHPPTPIKPREGHRNEAVSYGDLNDPTTGNNIYENIKEDVEPTYNDPYANHTYSNGNGNDSTYSNNSFTEDYSNSGDESTATVRGGGAPQHIMQRPRMPPPQPPTLPGMNPHSPANRTESGAVVTINGVIIVLHAT